MKRCARLLSRLFRHRLWDEADAARVLDDGALRRLQAQVAASEARHLGEIRVCVEASLPLSYLWRGATARERAVTMFGKLRVWDTEVNSGVLIYLLLAERAIEVVADRGLSRHVAGREWQNLVQSLSLALAAGRFEEGLAQAIKEVGALLEQHFPLQPGQVNVNELSDRVIRR